MLICLEFNNNRAGAVTPAESEEVMDYTYKINILEALKEKGYTTYYIRQNKLLSESTLQRLRNNQTISMTSLLIIANLLKMNITDII